MPVGLILGGASLVSGYLGNKAAQSQADVGRSQIGEARRQFDITNKQAAPFRQAGTSAVNKLAQLLTGGGQITPEMLGPGYQFGLQQGQNALQNYLGASGMRLSGRALQEAQKFGTDYATSKTQNYLGNLMQLAGYGPGAIGQSSQMGANLAGSPGYGTMAGAAGAGPAAWNQALQGGLSNYFAYKQNQDLLKALHPAGG